jgi:hypothetical protein
MRIAERRAATSADLQENWPSSVRNPQAWLSFIWIYWLESVSTTDPEGSFKFM